MSIKLWIIIICSFLIYNIYYDNVLLKNMKNYKKYYKIAIIVIMGIGTLTVLNKSPKMKYEHINTLNSFIKVMPIDKNTKDMLTPFLQSSAPSYNHAEKEYASVKKIQNSGKKSTKRSVSESKKKYVASQQNWCCSKCKKKLTHTFEIDHITRLEHGGNNDVNNLEALCRECHGQKTAFENF
tara:strand:+ start:12051 stop:12596 length:546 start_codon:yes stop_codon:yes gene_type:complete